MATALTQYLANRGIAYDVLLHPHTERASASAEASHVPGNRVTKAVVLKSDDVPAESRCAVAIIVRSHSSERSASRMQHAQAWRLI